MLLETAIDPACLSEERSLELFHRLRGIEGVVLLAIPQKWEKRAKAACGVLSHAGRAVKILETLRANNKFAERTAIDECSYAGSWPDCAAAHHRDLPIGLVVIPHENEEHSTEPFKTLDAAIDEHPCKILAAAAGKEIPFDPAGFASVVSPAVRYSRQVYFCDPYVASNAFARNKPHRVDSIVEAIRLGTQRRAFADPPDISIFIGPDGKSRTWGSLEKPLPREEAQVRNILANTEARIREKIGVAKATFTLVCVDLDLPDSRRFHNRYVLTERFGMFFGESIPDLEQRPESKDACAFLSRDSLTETFYSFQRARQEAGESRVRQFSL